MRITEITPREDDYVDFDRYDDDDPMERREIVAGHIYIARLVVNKLCTKGYAADYLVKVTDVIPYDDHRFQADLEEKIVAVLFEPCTLEGRPVAGAGFYSPYIEDGGYLYTCAFNQEQGKFDSEEQGYFLAWDSDDEVLELPEMLSGLTG